MVFWEASICLRQNHKFFHHYFKEKKENKPDHKRKNKAMQNLRRKCDAFAPQKIRCFAKGNSHAAAFVFEKTGFYDVVRPFSEKARSNKTANNRPVLFKLMPQALKARLDRVIDFGYRKNFAV